ncbi:MAG: NAD(P)/FAD-dependent oxidoreductase [Chitinophagales bacterium]|nr:NAD(P)/FAD-dependent oxidoreductase [Chitinophagales bacterium]
MHIVIIGNGITGITTARHLRKHSDHEITVISSESKFFFSRTALMYIYMGHMKFEHTKPYEDWFWKKNRINLVHAHVDNIDFEKKQCWLNNKERISYDKLVIASGSKPNNIGISFQKIKGAQGLYSMQDLELMEQNTKGISRAVIVGGGLIGIEMAEMLHSRGIHVTFLVMEKSYWNNVLPWEESQMITRHIRHHGIEVKLETQLFNIQQNDRGRVRAVVTDQDEEIPCEFLGVTAGVSPNVDFIRNSDVDTSRGILVNEYFETSAMDVYAAGDCAEFRNPVSGQMRIEQLWYTGKMQGEVLAQNLLGNRTAYNRGIWFNSAKFLNIEYQTYGQVPSVFPQSLDSLFWANEQEEKCIRIVYDKENMSVRGFNLLGIRYRHEVCERWISEQRKVHEVLTHLREANFDPEFFRRYEKEMTAQFEKEIHSKSKSESTLV